MFHKSSKWNYEWKYEKLEVEGGSAPQILEGPPRTLISGFVPDVDALAWIGGPPTVTEERDLDRWMLRLVNMIPPLVQGKPFF